MRTYLVDGTNAVRRGAYDPRFPEMEELRCREFVERLASLSAGCSGRVSIELFFDGPRRGVGEAALPVSVRFAFDDSADALILGTVRALRAAGRGVIVATEDAALKREVEAEGGRVIGFGALLDRLRGGKA